MIDNFFKIQYIPVADTKIYKVKDIDFYNLTIEAVEIDLSIVDIPESETFPVEELCGEFRIRIINNGDDSGMGSVIDFSEYTKIRKHIL